MTKVDDLIREFDQGFDQIPFTNTIYEEYNLLTKELECDTDFQALQSKQQTLQFEIKNLTQMRKKGFAQMKMEQLNAIDLAIDLDPRVIRIQQINFELEQEVEYINNKIKKIMEV